MSPRLFDQFVCVEASGHTRAYARPVVDLQGGELLFLAAPSTHTADVFTVFLACDRAADEGHDHVAVLGLTFDGREVARLIGVSGIYARAMGPFLRGHAPAGEPYEVGLAIVRGSLVLRDRSGAFALARVDEVPENISPVPVEAMPVAPRPVATERPS